MAEDKQNDLTVIQWLGFARKPDLSRARWLGSLLGMILGLLALALAALFVLLVIEVFVSIFSQGDQAADVRNIGLVLAAVVGAPFVVWRSIVAQQQADTAREGLITDRINKAVENLGAEKQSHDAEGKPAFISNLEVRIGAIYALERIAQDSPRDHIQVMEILCAYIRENAKAEDAPRSPHEVFEELTEDGDGVQGLDAETAFQDERFKRVNRYGWNPTELTIDNLRVWAQALPPPRTDLQTALDVIGRRDDAQIAIERAARVRGSKVGYRLDLRGTNLQKADLSELALDHALLTGARMEGANLRAARMEGANLFGARMEGAYLGAARMEGAYLFGARMEGANLFGARMEGAYLRAARMEGAYLFGARMEGAYLFGARMEGANLFGARMEGANLGEARMEGAYLRAARFDEKTNFTAAVVQYAAVKSVSFVGIAVDQDQVNTLFGDGSVTLPPGLAHPAHWPEDDLGWQDFRDQWRAWQRENGYTPRE